MNLVFLGPPGAGKGTQAELLSERCGIPKFATGDILRDAVRRDTRLGREAREYMDAGELVPDSVVFGLIQEALDSDAAADGFVLDGFPRNIVQAEDLTSLLGDRGRGLDAVVYFDVGEEELVRRLAGRRVCAGCGATYNIYSDPPAAEVRCDRCGGELITREDDREETVRNRLRVYSEQTAPVLDWYRRSEIPVKELEAEGSVEEVHRRLLDTLECS